MAKIKYFTIEQEEGIEDFGAKLSTEDYRQGRSHSGSGKTSWEKQKKKVANRKERYAASNFVDACLRAEGQDNVNEIFI